MTAKTAYRARGGTSYSSLPIDPLANYPVPDVFLHYRDVIRGLMDRVDMLAGTVDGVPSVVTQIVQATGSLALEPATATKLGGVKVGAGLVVTADGTLSYTLPVAGAGTLGGIKVGARLTIDAATGVLSADQQAFPVASSTVLGGVKIGDGITVQATGLIDALTIVPPEFSLGVNPGGRGYGVAWVPVAAKRVLMGPVSGAATVPTFRELVLSDLHPGVGQDRRYYYTHSQPTPAATWNVFHGLGKVPTGILVVRDDGVVVEPGIVVSPQAEDGYYEHVQAVASDTWIVNHGLPNVITGITALADGPGYVDPKFEIDRTTPFQVRIIFDQARTGKAYVSTGANSNQLTLQFLVPTAGKAYVSVGSGQPPYNHVQAASEAVWTVNHGLDLVPTQIQVFADDGSLLDPKIVVLEVAPYTLQLVFAQARTGQVWVS